MSKCVKAKFSSVSTHSLETYLINSMRGSGLKGLLGIPERANNLFRPLLEVLKDEILVYAEINNIDFREDSSNSKNDYYRNIIRNSIIPEFKKFDDNVMFYFFSSSHY